MKKKRVYSSQNNVMAHHVKNLLGLEGIEGEVRGELLGTAASAFMPSEAWVEVWVREEDYDKAWEIVQSMLEKEKEQASGLQCPSCGWKPSESSSLCRRCGAELEVLWNEGRGWRCSNCREQLEEQFDSCWSCGTERDRGDA